MVLHGKLYTESPIYRGNARKTLFTRDSDGTHRLISLAGEISGTAQSLMDAFIGRSQDGRNVGLLDQMWSRLYDAPMPGGLVTQVECRLQEAFYPRERFFDLRMGVRLDEDRWAVEANANYKMETVFRHSVFDLSMTVNETVLNRDENAARLYYLLQEIQAGRFWFGAGKSKGLGRLRLEMETSLAAPATAPRLRPAANHLQISLTFDATNPVLVGWNWGKVEPGMPVFAAVEGRLLVEAMRGLLPPLRDRLAMGLAGPILSPADWKQKFAEYLPRTIAIWLRERAAAEVETWTLPGEALKKLGKGKYGLSKKILDRLEPLVGQPFPGEAAAEAALAAALEDKANMANRVLKVMVQERQRVRQLDREAWRQVADGLGLEGDPTDRLAERIQDEKALTEALASICRPALPRLFDQVDQQIKLLQSDAWVDVELSVRQEHIRIKEMLLKGEISEYQWGDPDLVPAGIRLATWREFVEAHSRVQYRHMLHPRNLNKSITNDRNFVTFLTAYRDQARQELAQPHLTDFRAGGVANREVSRKYGQPYDTVFMRMLCWAPSSQTEGAWEVYIPGSTIKGACRKRAVQVLKTLWGESARTTALLDRLFGTQGQRGLAFFSDAYLADPHNPEHTWCSMDGVKMDPHTARPIEAAKRDYLYAYGEQLVFKLQLDLQDLQEGDFEALSLLFHLLQDFQQGDIPLGGEKTSGFGWVQAEVSHLVWLTADPASDAGQTPGSVGQKLFGGRPVRQDGAWRRLDLQGEQAADALQPIYPLLPAAKSVAQTPPRARAGFVSHRAFGGHCGTLMVEAEALTPLHIRESGEPSFKATLNDGPVNGWDFFSMAPPEAERRGSERIYALPSRSIKGMVRHIYAIASDSRAESAHIGQLNPADSLFGWVGEGPNQALMGRLSFSFGLFQAPDLAWFQAPYPYGGWQFADGRWTSTPGRAASMSHVDKHWRVFPHAPLAPLVKQLDGFQPGTFQASYLRAILPSARARFTIRFWNLDEQELQRLVWCVVLEPELAHKLGKGRYLGFGSLRLHVLPASFLIDWTRRYTGQPAEEWRLPFSVEQWINPAVIYHHTALRKALNAQRL